MKKTILVSLLLASTMYAGGVEFRADSDIPALNVVFTEENYVYEINLQNQQNNSLNLDLRTEGDIEDLINIPTSVTLQEGESRSIPVELNTTNKEVNFYTGTIIISSGETTENLPIAIRLTEEDQTSLFAEIASTSETIRPDDTVGIITILTSGGDTRTVEIEYDLRDAETGETITNSTTTRTFTGVDSFRHDIIPPESLNIGDYYIQSRIQEGNRTLTSTATLQVTDPFWTPTKTRIGLFLLIGGIIIGGGFYTQRWYFRKKEEDARYVFPVDYNRLPETTEDNYWVGKIAETDKQAHINPDDLTTHAIVSGSTGSGKSVTASVIVEEALENDVPVVVFDPTAQWTGFVKELKDDNLFEHYERFNLDKTEDPHPYRGVIKEIDNGQPDINFEELRNEGEITVFTLNQLTTEQFDDAVRDIIDQIFQKEWEESPELEMLIVFDEVHRLLEEYGGKGGYHALEKGAREFRKWGIGLMMCSQVTADFKQAISGNIMTEVQMQTKSMEDINRVKAKYGEEFAKRISSEDVGVGMIQNSNYNDGDPWFVDFRPTYHNPHKIPDQELEKYHKLSKELTDLKQKLTKMKEQGQSIRDKKLELQLAENKLKEGRFKMANMYIDSLKDEMDIS